LPWAQLQPWWGAVNQGSIHGGNASSIVNVRIGGSLWAVPASKMWVAGLGIYTESSSTQRQHKAGVSANLARVPHILALNFHKKTQEAEKSIQNGPVGV